MVDRPANMSIPAEDAEAEALLLKPMFMPAPIPAPIPAPMPVPIPMPPCTGGLALAVVRPANMSVPPEGPALPLRAAPMLGSGADMPANISRAAAPITLLLCCMPPIPPPLPIPIAVAPKPELLELFDALDLAMLLAPPPLLLPLLPPGSGAFPPCTNPENGSAFDDAAERAAGTVVVAAAPLLIFIPANMAAAPAVADDAFCVLDAPPDAAVAPNDNDAAFEFEVEFEVGFALKFDVEVEAKFDLATDADADADGAAATAGGGALGDDTKSKSESIDEPLDGGGASMSKKSSASTAEAEAAAAAPDDAPALDAEPKDEDEAAAIDGAGLAATAPYSLLSTASIDSADDAPNGESDEEPEPRCMSVLAWSSDCLAKYICFSSSLVRASSMRATRSRTTRRNCRNCDRLRPRSTISGTMRGIRRCARMSMLDVSLASASYAPNAHMQIAGALSAKMAPSIASSTLSGLPVADGAVGLPNSRSASNTPAILARHMSAATRTGSG